MGGGQPSYTTQTMKPHWKPGTGMEDYAYLDKQLGHQTALDYDPITGQPLGYTGPNQGMVGFDPYEQTGYSRGGNMASSGRAGGYASGYANQLYNQMSPQASDTLMAQMRGQYTTPTSQLTGSDRMAAQNVESILSGDRLDPSKNSAMNAIMGSIREQLNKQRASATSDTTAAFGGSGITGGSRHRQAQMQIEENADRGIIDAQAQMAMENLNQQDALSKQIMQGGANTRGQVAGNIYGMGANYDLNRQYTDADRLMQTGGYRRSNITDMNRDIAFQNQMRSWQHAQGAPGRSAELYAMLQRGTPNQVSRTQHPGIPASQQALQHAGTAAQTAATVGSYF